MHHHPVIIITIITFLPLPMFVKPHATGKTKGPSFGAGLLVLFNHNIIKKKEAPYENDGGLHGHVEMDCQEK